MPTRKPSGPPVVQFRGEAGVIDFGWGHPHPDALPVDGWAEAGHRALRRYGAIALTYGHATGPGPLIEWLIDRLGRLDGLAPHPDEVFVTAGASHALDLVATLLCRPGDAVVVDSPTYHLALRILADHRVDLVPAPADETGIDPQRTMELVGSLRRQGRRVPLLYLVPTFNNPTGRCLTADRREALAAAAQRDELTIVEDDTYRELCYDGPAPASLFTLSGGTGVARIGSFAKTVAPGLRLGWLTAAPALVRALACRGYVDSGGGVNHATALTMAEFATAGAYDRHLAAVRDRYRHQRDQLISAVRRDLPEVAFVPPAGGWFLWLRLPRPRGGTELLPAAVATGVSYLAGTHFFVADTGHEFARLAFSMLDPEVLAEGVRRLALASTAIAG